MGVATFSQIQIEKIKAALPSVEDIQKRVELTEMEYNLNKR